VKELTNGQGAGVLAELAPGGIESTIERIKNLERGGRVALIAPNPEPLNLPLRYLMIRSIEFTSVTGRFAMDVAELLELVQHGVIDTRHITTRYFPLTAVNEALDYIKTRARQRPSLADVRGRVTSGVRIVGNSPGVYLFHSVKPSGS
jgi:threonine dehydrogenase-like Zn-dependent dehydrogenase